MWVRVLPAVPKSFSVSLDDGDSYKVAILSSILRPRTGQDARSASSTSEPRVAASPQCICGAVVAQRLGKASVTGSIPVRCSGEVGG